MAWSIQLTPWALPPVLALLLLSREWLFLWPRRREPGSVALLVLGALAGLWAAFQLVATALPEGEAKVGLFQAQMFLASLVPVAWIAFCLVVAGAEKHLRRPAALLLYFLSVATAVMALGPGESLLVRSSAVLEAPSGYLGLQIRPGPGYWLHLVVRTVAVTVGSALVVRHMIRLPATRAWAILPVLATVLVLTPGALNALEGSVRPWRDLSAPTFGVAVAFLGWGILRHRLLDLGPVARTLVMVELRDPLVVLDGRGRIVDLNRAAERILGLQVYGDVPVALGTLWASARERADRYARLSLPVRAEDGTPPAEMEEEEAPKRVFEVTLTPLGRKDRSGGQTALLLRDVTDRDRIQRELEEKKQALEEANAELERLANTDSLTSLANRRHFMEALEAEMDRSRRYDRPLSLILLDLDHFKAVNDAYGHAAGDEVLQATADVMRAICRDVDLPARLGGEELAILLPETRSQGARTLAERLREELAAREHGGGDRPTFHVTASIGVATREGSEEDSAGSFLQRADAALYRAKEAGRNRVVVDAPTAEGSERR